jgi:hypothetical protein
MVQNMTELIDVNFGKVSYVYMEYIIQTSVYHMREHLPSPLYRTTDVLHGK